ncbi:hypothetical protein [Streptomyces sp. NPDC085659]
MFFDLIAAHSQSLRRALPNTSVRKLMGGWPVPPTTRLPTHCSVLP